MVHGYNQLTAQQFTVLGVLLRFGVHQALAQQQVDSDAFPSLRHTLYIHTGGKADAIVIGQSKQETGVEQTTVAVEGANHGILRVAEPCPLQITGAADVVVLSGHRVQPEAVKLIGHPRHDGPDVILRYLIGGRQLAGKNTVADHDRTVLFEHRGQVRGVVKVGMVDGHIVYRPQFVQIQYRRILPPPRFRVLGQKRIRHQDLSVRQTELEALSVDPAELQHVLRRRRLIGRLGKVVQRFDGANISSHTIPPLLKRCIPASWWSRMCRPPASAA